MEIVFAITQTITLITLLIFFLLREFRHRDDDQKTSRLIESYFEKVNSSRDNLIEKMSLSKDRLIIDTNNTYLKHVANLEKMITTPKPLAPTDRMVQQILDRTPPIVTENPIEVSEDEDSLEFTENNLRNIPIRRDTKIRFEDDMPPTEVID